MSEATPAPSSPLRRLLEIPVYPFLFGVYAVFFLWAQNVTKVRTRDVVSPLLYVMAGIAILFGVAWLVFRRAHRAAIVVAVLSLLFFSFGHVVGSSTKVLQEASKAPPHQGLWLIVWGLIAAAAIIAVAVRRPDGRRAAFVLNLVLAVMLTLSAASIVTQKVQAKNEAARALASAHAAPAPTSEAADATSKPAESAALKRDVYFVVIDRYADAETLRRNYGFDNTPYLEALERRGFVVPPASRGAYPKTPHSISAALNMDYVNLPEDVSNWQLIYDSLKGSKSSQVFKRLGYKYVLVGSGYHALREDPAADENLVYDPKAGPVQSEFGQVLYDSTVLAAIAKRYHVGALDERSQTYQRLLFQFQKMADIPKDPAPTFMFAHLIVTHPPFVVDRDGDFMSEKRVSAMTEHEVYLEGLQYANRRMIELIDRLQKAYPPDRQPIIVVQSDEGPGPVGWNPNTKEHFDWTRASQQVLDEKFRIFNAFYLPGQDRSVVPPNIGHPNTFRLILSRYFGAELPLLPERSYVFPNEQRPYEFIDVTERVKN